MRIIARLLFDSASGKKRTATVLSFRAEFRTESGPPWGWRPGPLRRESRLGPPSEPWPAAIPPALLASPGGRLAYLRHVRRTAAENAVRTSGPERRYRRS